VQYLLGKGYSPQHILAGAYGEFQPIDEGDSDDALRRNRRIELKITER
jgi:chemotaxis protein MotB